MYVFSILFYAKMSVFMWHTGPLNLVTGCWTRRTERKSQMKIKNEAVSTHWLPSYYTVMMEQTLFNSSLELLINKEEKKKKSPEWSGRF